MSKNQNKKTNTYHLEIFLVLLNDNIISRFFLYIYYNVEKVESVEGWSKAVHPG